MPYTNVNQLPGALQSTLPARAQHIYKEAYNDAWRAYSNAGMDNGGSREEVAHKMAWGAVKRTYRKNGTWKLKEES